MSICFARSTLILALCLAAGSAGAEEQVLSTADPAVVLDIAKGYGSATLEKDSDGDPKIAGRIQGVRYTVFFYDCAKGENCRSVQLSTGYVDPFTIEKANEWNAKYRWVKAYGKDGSNFRMDFDFEGGVTRKYVDVQFGRWEDFIGTIKEFIETK